MPIQIPNNWRPRRHQLNLYNSFGHGKQFQRGAAVWHRRAGKDSTALNLTARDMCKRVGTYWHLFPEQAQARRAIWNGIDKQGRRIMDQVFPGFSTETGFVKRRSSQEMLIETANGSIWQMAGSDNFNSLVGSNPVGVVFSEWSLAHPEAWDYIRPILVENGGWALFIYTPRGRNHGFTTYGMSQGNPDWFCERLTVDDTGIMGEDDIQAERDAGMPEAKIRQEFYCSFEAETERQLINYDAISAAQSREIIPEPFDERIIGVDVARFGEDKSVIYFRQGANGNPIPYERFEKMDTMQLAARVAHWCDQWRPHGIFVDDGGVGGGVVDRLRQLGYRAQGVNFGGKSDSPRSGEKASNKRTEMWLNARAWIERGHLPADELLAMELTAPLYSYDSHNAIVLEKKDDMRKRGVASPDVADAFALTFAYPVQVDEYEAIEHFEDYGSAVGMNADTGY